MKTVAKLLQSFWGGFGLPAYPEYSVPNDKETAGDSYVKPAYITYTIPKPDFTENAVHQARVWYQSTTFTDILAKVDEIERAIGPGVRVESDDGMLVLRPGALFSQFQPIDSPDLKVAYLNLQLNFFGKEE